MKWEGRSEEDMKRWADAWTPFIPVLAAVMDPSLDQRASGSPLAKSWGIDEHAGEMDGDGLVSYPADKPTP